MLRNDLPANTLVQPAPGRTLAPDVFISYSSHDKAVADRVFGALKTAGVKCWKAPESLTPGRSYPSQIIAAINQCRVMVFILSKSSNSSQQVLREVERAVNRDIILVPFRIEPVTPTGDLEYYLSVPHWLDAYEPPLEPHLETLIDTIAQLLAPGEATLESRRQAAAKSAPPPPAVETARPGPDAEEDGPSHSPVPPPQESGSATDLARKVCPRCGTEYTGDMDFCPKDGSTLRVRDSGKGLVGSIVAGRYRILQKMGRGGMGEVYLAEHVKMGRKSAIKLIHPSLLKDVDVVRRFGREASNASRIMHPNVATIYDFGEDEGLVYIAMEFVDGQSLDRVIKSGGAMSEDRAKDITCQVAEALQAAHDEGVVHRDLKPDNIMIAQGRKGRDVVKVVDFGIAKAIEADPEQEVTQTGLVVGTPRYMSPEQLAGDPVDARSDLYSLGSILFEMLTGAPAFTGPTGEVLLRRRTAGEAPHPRQLRPSLSKALDAIVVKAMDAVPANRFGSATDFRDAVVAAAGVDAALDAAEKAREREEAAAKEAAAKDAAAKAAAAKEAAAKEAAVKEAASKEAAAKEAAAKEVAAKQAAAKEAAAKQAAAKEAAAKEAAAKEAARKEEIARATAAKKEAAAKEAAAKEAAAKEAAAKEAAAKEAAKKEAARKEAAARESAAREAAALAAAAKEAARKEEIARATAAKETARKEVAAKEVAAKEAAAKEAARKEAAARESAAAVTRKIDGDQKPKSRLLPFAAVAVVLVIGATITIQALARSTTDGDEKPEITAANTVTTDTAQTVTTTVLDPVAGPPTPDHLEKKGTPAADRAARDAAAKLTAANKAAADSAARELARTAKEVADKAAADKAAADKAAADKAAAEKVATEKVATEKDAAARDAITVRRNLLASANDEVSSCVAALRSNNAVRMAQLYSAASSERTNREKLLARMREAASRLTVSGSPEIGPPQMEGESAYADFNVRLTWRGNFGQTVNKVLRFRATIASTGGNSQIGCRIIGNADL